MDNCRVLVKIRYLTKTNCKLEFLALSYPSTNKIDAAAIDVISRIAHAYSGQ